VGARLEWDVVVYGGFVIADGSEIGGGGNGEDGGEVDVGEGGSEDCEHSVRALATVKILVRSRPPRSCLELVS
jgi:hypothetical protein